MKIRDKTQRQLLEKELQYRQLKHYKNLYKSYDCYRCDRLTLEQNNYILFLTKKIRRMENILNLE